MKNIKQAILDKILFIGDEIPLSLVNDKRDKFILLGTPQKLIDETTSLKSLDEIEQWIADYCYKRVNPESKMDTPSIIYELVHKDFNNFLNS